MLVVVVVEAFNYDPQDDDDVRQNVAGRPNGIYKDPL